MGWPLNCCRTYIAMGQIKTFFGILFIGLVLLTSPTGWAGPGASAAKGTATDPRSKFGIVLAQFEESIFDHVDRIEVFAIYIVEKYSDRFPNLAGRHKLVEARAREHDREKWDKSPGFYKKIHYKYDNPRSILERLFEHFGGGLDLDPELKAELRRMEEASDKAFLDKYKLFNVDGTLSPAALELQSLMRIADYVDRGENPFAEIEFGRKMIKASDFKGLNQLEKNIALDLEGKYLDMSTGRYLPSTLSPDSRTNLLFIEQLRYNHITSHICKSPESSQEPIHRK
jgi:hypothetical protein